MNDPLISEEHICAFEWSNKEEIEEIYNMSLKINNFLSEIFIDIGIKVIDFKLEFGKLKNNSIVLADELSPDNFRLWDKDTSKNLIKIGLEKT